MTRLLQLAEALKNGDTTAEEAAAELERTYSPEELRAAQRTRDQYNSGVASMRATEASMRVDRASDEEIARVISPMRNDEKVAARALMSPEEVQVLEARNDLQYENPIGPTPDYLYARYGSWQKVINAAYRTNPDLSAILARLGR